MYKVRKYFFRLIVINFFSLLYLIDTTSFDYGFFSIQSLFYSLNIYLLYFFILFETALSLLGYYGLEINFFTLIINDFDNLNYEFVKYIIFQNINFFYFLLFSSTILFFLEKKNYSFNTIKKNFNFKKKVYVFSFFILFILSNFNPNLTHNSLLLRYKLLTNSWSEVDLFYHKDKFSSHIKNNFFRNDNWYEVLKFSMIYSKSVPFISKNQSNKIISENNFNNFEDVIGKKNYNNIYVVINESYPNFKDKYLKDNLFNQIVAGNKDLSVERYKKKWNKSYSTQGAEIEFFCNKKVDYKSFKQIDFRNFISENKCWIDSYKNKNLIYIHSYYDSVFNRKRYKNYFDEVYFAHELKALNFKICGDQTSVTTQFAGICDYKILENLEKITKSTNNNFIIFLTLNNHIPVYPTSNKSFIDCKKHYPLNLNDQFCNLYNNQMLFNNSVSKFLSRMGKEDILVFFSDTPPLFHRKDRIHFEDTIDVYFFSKT